MRLPLLALFLFLATTSARAEVVTLDVPTGHTPGAPSFDVTVGLAPVQNLGLYNVEVVFRTAGSIAGLLTVDPATAAPAGYVFPSATNFLASPLSAGNEYRVTLSDFTLDATGPDVTAGGNDRIATLTVRPTSALTGPIEVFVDGSSLFVDDANGTSLLTGGPLPAATIDPIPVNEVPAPAGVVCALIGLGLVGVRKRVVRRSAA